MSTYISNIHNIVQCFMTEPKTPSSPLLADVLFVGACYMLIFPELRPILRRRFINKSLKFLSFVTSIGITSFLMMVTTAAQTRATFCRYLRPVVNGMSREHKQILGFLVVSFFIVFNVFLARSTKTTVSEIWQMLININRPKREELDLTEISALKHQLVSKRRREVLPNKLQPLPLDWKKMTRNGTVYGD